MKPRWLKAYDWLLEALALRYDDAAIAELDHLRGGAIALEADRARLERERDALKEGGEKLLAAIESSNKGFGRYCAFCEWPLGWEQYRCQNPNPGLCPAVDLRTALAALEESPNA